MIYRWNGTGWTLESGGLTKILVLNASSIYGISNGGYIYKRSGGGWTRLGTLVATDFDAAPDGTVLGVASSVGYSWNGSTWVALSSVPHGLGIDHLFPVNSSTIYGYFSNGGAQNLYQYISGVWTQITQAPNASTAQCLEYVGRNGSLWSILGSGTDSSIYRYVSGAWQLVSAGFGVFAGNAYSTQAVDGTFTFLVTVYADPVTGFVNLFNRMIDALKKVIPCDHQHCVMYQYAIIAGVIGETIGMLGSVAVAAGFLFGGPIGAATVTAIFTAISCASTLAAFLALGSWAVCGCGWTIWGK
jgi:hypothetical protein